MKEKAKHAGETERLWAAAYPDDPFVVDLSPGAEVNAKYTSGSPSFSYDIIAAADRQKEFYYQVGEIVSEFPFSKIKMSN